MEFLASSSRHEHRLLAEDIFARDANGDYGVMLRRRIAVLPRASLAVRGRLLLMARTQPRQVAVRCVCAGSPEAPAQARVRCRRGCGRSVSWAPRDLHAPGAVLQRDAASLSGDRLHTCMPGCLICEGTLWEWFSFGSVPLANGFLRAEDFDRECFYDLRVGRCEGCGTVQLLGLVERDHLFHDRYPFFTSTSRVMGEHFKSLAHWIQARLDSVRPFIVEIGSNDGTLLQHCAAIGARTLGVEPSGNVAAAAITSGVPTLVTFFDARCAREIASQEGHADAVVATNVLSHISDLHSVLEGCHALLTPRGLLVLEDPYLVDVLDNTCYDQFYDEHVFYFCASSVHQAVARHGLELIDLQPQPVHGGSMVYVCAKRGIHQVSPRVDEQLAREHARGLGAPETYTRFAARIKRSRDRLLEILHGVRRGGYRLAGYAATSKSTTVLNYCQIGPALLEYVCDSTPMKQGLFTPGMHIPVVSPERFHADPPDYALLFGWNHAKEILTKEASFTNAGGRWITYVPDVSVSEHRRAGLPVFKRRA